MPSLSNNPRFKGITLPPSGWVLAVLLAVYIFTGLIGHDPWKHDDAISIGLAYDVLRNGHWLTPELAGQAHPDAPLYYWTAAITGHLFSWILPAHDAIRVASGIFTLLALQFILLAARELHGRENAAAAPLILAGSIGFLYHAHEAQPMLTALTAHTAAYWALILLPRRPLQAGLTYAIAAAVGFLANGLLPIVTLIPVTVLALWQSTDWKKYLSILIGAILLALILIAAWLLPLQWLAPDYLAAFFASEIESLSKNVQPWANTPRYLNLLLWYAWPALPLAAWALWAKRRQLRNRTIALPALAFLSTLLILGVSVELRSAPSLLLLPPLVLLAVPGVMTLRRGAAAAFDWFAMMTFTLFAAIVWVAWSAMVFGWPQRLARQAVRLEPGFVGHFDLLNVVFALLATLAWVWLIVTSPRSPMRSLMHWMSGLTLFWLLVASLWMQWIDYGKTFRAVSSSVARVVADPNECLANANLPDAIVSSLHYFDGLRTVPFQTKESAQCRWLIMQGQPRDPGAIADAGWRKVWEGRRPGDRRESDKFQLYRRSGSARKAAQLTDIPVEGPEDPAVPR